MIRISHPTQSIVVPYRGDLQQLFPHGKRILWEGEDLFGVPHGIDETRLFRNLDYPVPAPVLEHYHFPSADGLRPFDKQLVTTAMMTMQQHCYVLNDMGTGKTKSCLWAHDYLQSVGRVRRMLVVAPLSTLVFTWEREIMATLPHKVVRVLTGSAQRRHKLLAEKADIYIINHDGMEVVYKELLKRPDIDVVCFDEAAAYRNARADRSKIAKLVANRCRYVWGMTGSPTPSAPTDAYGLAQLITPESAPRAFTHFRQETMLQVSQFKWVPRNDAKATVAKVLQPSVRFSLDDIVELPPLVVRDVEVEMGKRQKAVYEALREHAAALLKEGTITAVNGGVVFSKLLQTSLGWVYSDKDREIIPLDNAKRLQALLDIIESCDNKLLIFSPFKSATAGIAKVLVAEKIDHAVVTGDTPHGERTKIFNVFQNTDKIKVLNAHPECMSHGLTLTAADTVVWFGPVTKLETYEQANARISRVGQTRKQQIIRLVSTPAERTLYRRLALKQDMQESMLDILAAITEAGDQT
jgi:SNF2 family DNA or RNA helicase